MQVIIVPFDIELFVPPLISFYLEQMMAAAPSKLCLYTVYMDWTTSKQ